MAQAPALPTGFELPLESRLPRIGSIDQVAVDHIIDPVEIPQLLTRLVNTPNPMEIVQTDKKVVLLFEGFNQFIIVPTDGRKHTADPDPTWFGESIGWYEGDTLVIDTVAFNGKARLDTIGHPFSDKLHLIQRYTRDSPDTLAYEITVEDPVMYSKPFTNKRVWRLRSDWELIEYSCMENNKDLLEGHIKSLGPKP